MRHLTNSMRIISASIGDFEDSVRQFGDDKTAGVFSSLEMASAQLKYIHDNLVELGADLNSPEFTHGSDSDRSKIIGQIDRNIRSAQEIVVHGYGNAARNAQGEASYQQSLADGYKAVRDFSVSAAQAIGKTEGVGWAAGLGTAQAVITRTAADLGVELAARAQGLSAPEKERLRAATERHLGPASMDFVNAAGSPLMDKAANGWGDYVVTFGTTLIQEMRRGASLEEAGRKANAEGLKAQALGAAAGKLVDQAKP